MANMQEKQIRVTMPEEQHRKQQILSKRRIFRWVILLLSILCMTIVSANALLLNFIVICIEGIESQRQGILLAGTAIGGILAIGIVPHLISLFGLRLVFSIAGLLSGLFTLFQPQLYTLGGFYALLAVRILQGACAMPALPAMSEITHHWASQQEQGAFLTLLSMHLQLSVIVSMPSAGALCASSWGWSSAYYLFGFISIVLFIVFLFVYRNSPEQPSQNTVTAIDTEKQKETTTHFNIPYTKILKDVAVWAWLAICLCCGLTYWLFAQFGPIYMSKVLHYNMEFTGIWVALPYACAILSKMIVPIFERISFFTIRFRVIWLPIFCHLINACCYAILGLFPTIEPTLAQLIIIAVLSINGIAFVAVANNCQVIAQQYSHFLMSFDSLLDYFINLGQPLIISWLVKENTAQQWSFIFIGYAVLLFALIFAFGIGSGSKARKWTRQEDESSE